MGLVDNGNRVLICPQQTGPFLVSVSRGEFSWLEGAERHEGIEVLGPA